MKGVSLIYVDGRHAPTALSVAQRKGNIPLLFDLEKERGMAEDAELELLADYFLVSGYFEL